MAQPSDGRGRVADEAEADDPAEADGEGERDDHRDGGDGVADGVQREQQATQGRVDVAGGQGQADDARRGWRRRTARSGVREANIGRLTSWLCGLVATGHRRSSGDRIVGRGPAPRAPRSSDAERVADASPPSAATPVQPTRPDDVAPRRTAMLAFGEAVVSSDRGRASPPARRPAPTLAAARSRRPRRIGDATVRRRAPGADRAADRPDGGTARSTTCSVPPSRRRPACSRPTGRWSTSSTRRPGTLRFAHDAGIKSKRSRDTGPRDRSSSRGPACSAAPSRSGPSSSPSDYPNDPAFPHAPGPDQVVADIGIRSMVVAPLVAGDEVYRRARHVQPPDRRLRCRPDRPRPLAGRPRRGGDGQRPPHRGARPVPLRAGRAGRGRAQRCARSTPGSRPPPTCRPCCSARSTRRPACCAPTAPASTSSTGRSGLLRWAYASGALKPDDDDLARRPGRDARPGRLRPGRRHRPDRSGPATTSTTTRFPHGAGAEATSRRPGSARSWPRRSSARSGRSGR